MTAANKFIPRAKGKVSGANGKRRQPASATLLDKIRFKRRAYKIYKKYKTQENYNTYAKARNQVKWETRRGLREKETKLAKDAKVNPKKFYQYVAERCKPKEKIANLKKRRWYINRK